MLLHRELLELAFALSASTKQAYRRRSISSAYYALFHRLAHESSSLFFPGADESALYAATARAFDHRTMLNVCLGFAELAVPKGPVKQLLEGAAIPDELRRLSQSFVSLQRARHSADYDLTASFTPINAKERCFEAKQAFMDLEQCRLDPTFRLFFACLLFANSWRT